MAHSVYFVAHCRSLLDAEPMLFMYEHVPVKGNDKASCGGEREWALPQPSDLCVRFIAVCSLEHTVSQTDMNRFLHRC